MWELLISMLTRYVTGLDENNLKMWEFQQWIYSYCRIESIVLYSIVVALFVLLIVIMIMIYKLDEKIIDLNEEA